MAKKIRLDNFLVQLGLVDSEKTAQALIMSGKVDVDGVKIDKPGTQVSNQSKVEIRKGKEFVGRGAYKLSGALKDFAIDVSGLICADVGASTGGFTEILLKQGAQKVYAIDVGFGELDYQLRKDSRVIVMERTNARHLKSLPELIAFCCIDVSFISLKLILPVVSSWLAETANLICLIKPQFEAKREEVGEGGIVTDGQVHRRVVEEIMDTAKECGLSLKGLALSQLPGAQGNKEFFIWLSVPNNTKAEDKGSLLSQLFA